MATIKATTVLAHPVSHEPVVLLEGTEAPDWAVEAITNPDVLDQADPKAEPLEAASEAGDKPAPEPVKTTSTRARTRKS